MILGGLELPVHYWNVLWLIGDTRWTERTTLISMKSLFLDQVSIFILWSSGKGQARKGKGWLLRRKASKLKPLPRAYIKVVCALSNDTKCMTHFFREAEVTKPPTLACWDHSKSSSLQWSIHCTVTVWATPILSMGHHQRLWREN